MLECNIYRSESQVLEDKIMAKKFEKTYIFNSNVYVFVDQ